jgi:hypothetical protein
VKVEEGEKWLQIYKELMVATGTLCESRSFRRTRTRDILVELKAVNKGETLPLIKEVIGNKVLVSPLQSRVSLEIRDIDSLESREDIKQDIISGLMIKDTSEV